MEIVIFKFDKILRIAERWCAIIPMKNKTCAGSIYLLPWFGVVKRGPFHDV